MKSRLDLLLRILGAIMLCMVALGLFSRASSQTQDRWWNRELMPWRIGTSYQVTNGKVVTWAAYGVAGTLWGAREAYHADPYVFESRGWGGPYSFFGSNAWERNYNGNRYQGPDGRINAHKTEVFNAVRDVHHFFGFANRGLMISGTFTLAANKNHSLAHRIMDVGLGLLISSASASATYTLLR